MAPASTAVEEPSAVGALPLLPLLLLLLSEIGIVVVQMLSTARTMCAELLWNAAACKRGYGSPSTETCTVGPPVKFTGCMVSIAKARRNI